MSYAARRAVAELRRKIEKTRASDTAFEDLLARLTLGELRWLKESEDREEGARRLQHLKNNRKEIMARIPRALRPKRFQLGEPRPTVRDPDTGCILYINSDQ